MLQFSTKLNKFFWLLCIVTFGITSWVSYGFVTKLFFWREDYKLIYSYFAGVPYHTWPYQGISIIYYPFALLFKTHPNGYFIIGLILYIALSLLLSFFVLRINQNRITAFLAGLIFASGYIGSEAMFLVMTNIASLVYLIFTIILLLLYRQYVEKACIRTFLPPFVTHTILLILFSHRAYISIPLLVLTDIFYTKLNTREIKICNIRDLFKRILPFFTATIFVYIFFPILLGAQEKRLQNFLTTERIVNSINLNVFREVGNILVPSSLQQIIVNRYDKVEFLLLVLLSTLILLGLGLSLFSLYKKFFRRLLALLVVFSTIHIFVTTQAWGRFDLYLGSMFGLYGIFCIVGLLSSPRLNREFRSVLGFLAASVFVLYLPFHIFEYNIVHPSWHRYLIFVYPFWATLLALILTQAWRSTHTPVKISAVIILSTQILLNIIFNRTSEFTKTALDRSLQAKKFFLTLQQEIPQSKEKTLLYIDVINDALAQSTVNGILAAGIFPSETALAAILQRDMQLVKITYNWDDFARERGTKTFTQIFTFFYDKNRHLTNTTDYTVEEKKYTTDTTINLSPKTITPYINNQYRNQIQFFDNSASYTSNISKNGYGLTNTNFLLAIETQFPSYTPIALEIRAKGSILSDAIKTFPYQDVSFQGSLTDAQLEQIHNNKTRQLLLKYISSREEFKKTATLTSTGNEPPTKEKFLIDGDTETSWISRRKVWATGTSPWIQIDLPKEYTIQEVRWISGSPNRLPLSYEYSVSDNGSDWHTIFSAKNHNVKANEYTIDSITPTKTSHFRMIILKSGGDTPSIAEIELLPDIFSIDSKLADIITQYPLANIENRAEMNEILKTIKNNLKFNIWPISDKYPDKMHSIRLESPSFLDNYPHTYKVIVPPGGTTMKELLLEFPNLPLNIEIGSIILRTKSGQPLR